MGSQELLAGAVQGELPVLQLPADYPRPAVQQFEGDRVPVHVGS